jgi:hypothetical protein
MPPVDGELPASSFDADAARLDDESATLRAS